MADFVKVRTDVLTVKGVSNVITGITDCLYNINGQVTICYGAGVPLASAVGYAVGAEYTRTSNGAKYVNTGSVTAATWTLIGTISSNTVTTAMLMANVVTSAKLDTGVLQVDKVSISAANIISGTTMKALVAAPASGSYIEFVGCTISYTYGTATYGGGGNVTIALGTTPISGLISAAASFGKGSSAIIQFAPLAAAAVDISGLSATALNINVASGAFTNPGTAAGTAVAYVAYRIHTLT